MVLGVMPASLIGVSDFGEVSCSPRERKRRGRERKERPKADGHSFCIALRRSLVALPAQLRQSHPKTRLQMMNGGGKQTPIIAGRRD